MPSLFDQADFGTVNAEWDGALPPDVTHIRDLEIDFETAGLRWWAGEHPVGAGVALPDGSTYYLAWGHRGGGNNISEEAAKDWFRALRKKRITNTNVRFEVHQAREWGNIDFEAQECEVSDVSHYAALLDDRRQKFSQEVLVKDFLKDEAEEKVKVVNGIVLDGSQMAEYHASVVSVRARADVRQVQKLKKVMWPLLDAQDLQRVRALEDDVIYPVCEMERNAAVVDIPLLNQMATDAEQAYLRALWEIHRETGIANFNPNAQSSWLAMFKHEGIDPPLAATGRPTFKDVYLKRIDNKNIQLGRKAGKLADLLSKYLHKMQRVISSDGKLRYALHQLRSQKDEWSNSGEAGTISGRFASTEICEDEGWNQQQVMKVIKQWLNYGPDYIIRELFPAEDPNWLFFSADAMQIEYRLFAHYANNPAVIEAYQKNPEMSFHKFVWELIKPFKPDITYRQQKDLNFAKIYGAGLKKLALMLEFITEAQFEELNRTKARNDHPLLAKAKEVEDIYNRLLPEVGPLLRRASHLAMPYCSEFCRRHDELHRTVPHRGFVKTILGRRTRFETPHDRIHKAFNGVDQGSAADIMKQKLVELHRARKYTQLKLRWTVHDEVDGDIPDLEHAQRVGEILNRQSFPDLKVPILWEWKTGKTWRDCADEDPGREKAA